MPNFRADFKAKILLTVTTCRRAWRVLQLLNHEDNRHAKVQPRWHLALSSANSTNNKCSRPRAENRTPHCPPPCCCTEWRLLTGSLQRRPAGSFRGEWYTYQEIPKSHSGAAIQRKPSFSIIPEPQCLLQGSPEESSIGNHQNAHLQMSRYGRRPIYMQLMMTQPETPRKSCQFFQIDSPSDDHTDSRKADKDE